MVVVMGFPFVYGVLGAGRLCDGNCNEQVFYSLPEQVFGVKEFFEQAFSEQMFAFPSEHLYDLTHV